MDLALPEDIQQQLQGFEELLSTLEGKLAPYVAPGSKRSIEQLDPLERAQTHLALAHAAHALFQLFLKASGADTEGPESRKERERLKQYGKKVRKVAADKELKESRRSLEVNVAAVNRFISAAVPDLSRDQKAALRGGGGRQRAATDGGGEGAPAGDAEDAAAAFLQETMAGLGGADALPQGQQAQQQQGEQQAQP